MAMGTKHSKARRARRGAAAVELALTAPILLAMAGGVIEWGWYMNQQINVIQAARDGARAGSLIDSAVDDPAAVAAVRVSELLDGYGIAAADGDITTRVEVSAVGSVVFVEAGVVYVPLLNLVPTPDRLRAHTTMRLAVQP